MLIASIGVVSIVAVYLMRTGDIFIAFRKENLKLTLIASFVVLLLLSVNVIKILYLDISQKEWRKAKATALNYLLRFNLFTVILVAFVREAVNANQLQKSSFIKAYKKEPLITIIRRALPTVNDRAVDIVY